MESLEKRIAALEANPIPILVSALEKASPEDAKSLVFKLQELVFKYVPAEDGAPKKPLRAKRETYNKESLGIWNSYVKNVQHELASKAGVDYDSFFDGIDPEDSAEMKKAEEKFKSAAKEAGAGWHVALKEASRRKDEEEGRDHSEKEAKKAAAKTKKSEKATITSTKAPVKIPAKAKKSEKAPVGPEKKADEARKTFGIPEEVLAEYASVGMAPHHIDGDIYMVDEDTDEVFTFEDNTLGDRVGIFNKSTGSIVMSE